MTMRMSLKQVAGWLDPALPVGLAAAGDLAIRRVHTDSRSVQPGDLFVALRGERFDANAFLGQARSQGAVAAIVQGEAAHQELLQTGWPGLVTPDTLQALAQLATHYRSQFQPELIAVTGSNGKTTVTQMIAAILHAAWGEAALATQGNLNNEIGVPLTLLRLGPEHRMAVVELGMNHPGEVARLAAMAQPTVALVNNAQREHLEFMQTVQAVAEENGAVLCALPAQGVAVFPADDAYSALWRERAGARRMLRFATRPGVQAEVSLQHAVWQGTAWQLGVATPTGELSYRLGAPGAHNLRNSLAAVACALAAGLSAQQIVAGLGAFAPVKGRSQALTLHCGRREVTVVDDSYNANPDSVAAAIDVLAELPGPRLLVLGDMGEVGDQGPRFHAEALAHALDRRIDKVLVTGVLFAQAAHTFKGIQTFAGMAELQAAALSELGQAASVLVKGSRFMQMERVVQALCKACQPAGSAAC